MQDANQCNTGRAGRARISNHTVHSLTHQSLHLPRCIKADIHYIAPNLQSSPLLGIKQHREISQIHGEMVLGLLTCSRSSLHKAGQPRTVPMPVSTRDARRLCPASVTQAFPRDRGVLHCQHDIPSNLVHLQGYHIMTVL